MGKTLEALQLEHAAAVHVHNAAWVALQAATTAVAAAALAEEAKEESARAAKSTLIEARTALEAAIRLEQT